MVDIKSRRGWVGVAVVNGQLFAVGGFDGKAHKSSNLTLIIFTQPLQAQLL